MSQKSYDGSNALYLIPTPIGNKEDITIRALNTLKMVDIIFTEDTRETKKLLNMYDINTKLISNHEHNELENKTKLVTFLRDNKNIGLVTDRGTPIISDPGYILAKYAIEEGFNVISLPGPTALIPALTSSGIAPQPFTFIGFLSNKEAKRKKELDKYKSLESTLIFYESNHRIKKFLNDVLQVMGDRRISVSREISKKYEEIYRGVISEILLEIQDVAKGEFVIVVEGNTETENFNSLDVISHVNALINIGYDKMDAIKKVSKERNMSKQEIYKEFNK